MSVPARQGRLVALLLRGLTRETAVLCAATGGHDVAVEGT